MNDIKFHRINCDVNGNPRYVVHFLAFVPEGKTTRDYGGYEETFKLARIKAAHLGGKLSRSVKHTGMFVFTTYSTQETERLIKLNQLH